MGFLNIEGIDNPDISKDVKQAVDGVNNSRDNISRQLNLVNDPQGYKKNIGLVNELRDSNSAILDSVGNILSKSYDIQINSTEQARNASMYLDRSNKYLGELVEDSNHEINELKIQKDNKKRIIEMQRNRLFKYKHIKQSLLYLILVILICGIILYIERIFSKIKPFSSILLVAVGVVSSIFFIFRMVDYFRRSKFNFRQYDIMTGGDKYKKTVYQYDSDQIQSMGDYATNEMSDGLEGGLDNLQSGLQSMRSDKKNE